LSHLIGLVFHVTNFPHVQAREARAKLAQSRRAKRVKASEGEEDLVVDNRAVEGTDEGEQILAVQITQEYWGPKSGKHRFAQRLFRVLFSDDSSEDLVAEDVKDHVPLPFEINPFYAKVLQDWRRLHPVKPGRPDV